MTGRPVLVVDDDPDNRRLLSDILSSEGYAVTTVSNGREALKHLPISRPFVIVLDLEMPVMDGRTFRLHQLQLTPPLRSIPVIVYSGSDEAAKLTAELVPFACLSKPLPDFNPLLQQVEAAYQLSAELSAPE